MTDHRIAIDIGSTVIKLAKIDGEDRILSQHFFERDFESGIPRQVESILSAVDDYKVGTEVLICSSANGGLRVGILCLSSKFSGAALRNQVLLAGANPVYLHEFDDEEFELSPVDILLIGGGIDCEDCDPLMQRLRRMNIESFKYRTLMYAGNKYAAQFLTETYPDSYIVPNPFEQNLVSPQLSVFEAVRNAYLLDIVHKEGVSELRKLSNCGIRPTPEVVNRGFRRSISHRSTLDISGASIVVDIGGATTDLHYTVEIIREDSADKPQGGRSVARYVFTDLGIVASRESTLTQMRAHARIYEFLSCVLDADVKDTYRSLREGEYSPSQALLSYGCLFLAFERFSRGHGPGLPTANFNKVSNVILTGGAVQDLSTEKTQRILSMISGNTAVAPQVQTDSRYQLWVDGITWKHE